jgi:hypothetical protein
MKSTIDTLKQYQLPIYLAFLVLVVLIPLSPQLLPVSGADPAVFVYIGDHILDGDIPYLDHFGNKGPLTYYINALGLLIRGGSLWGVWAVQIAFLYSSALLGFYLMSKAFGHLPSIFGSTLWILHLSQILREGNFTEQYAILFQFIALLFFWFSEEKQFKMRYSFLIGVSFAFGFLLRPNNVGISTSVIIYLALRWWLNKNGRANFAKRIAYIFIGFGAVQLLVGTYFLSVGALDELFEAVFLFNISLNLTEGSTLQAILFGVDALLPIFIVSFVAWILALVQRFSSESQLEIPSSIYPLSSLMAIAFPVEIFLATYGGKGLNHYFISWMPILGILSAFFAYRLLRSISGKVVIRGRQVEYASIWLLAFLLILSVQPANRLITKSNLFVASLIENRGLSQAGYSEQDSETINLIQRLTEKDDYLLIWGFELQYYFIADREAPSRFAYQYPFSAPDFATQEMIDELINEIATKKPLIIETAGSDNSTVPPIGSSAWDKVPGMDKVMDFIFTNYAVTTLIGPEKWPVYQYVGSNQ